MADEFAIVSFTVPGSTGTQDLTDSAITTWSTRGVAIIVIAGNEDDEAEGARLTVGRVDHNGTLYSTACKSEGGNTISSFAAKRPGDAAAFEIVDDSSNGGSVWAAAAFSSALTNGVRINWTDVSGVSGRTFHGWCILMAGMDDLDVGTTYGTTALGIAADALLSMGHNGSNGGTQQAHASWSFGACVNDGADTQESVTVSFTGSNTPETGAYTNTSNYTCNLNSNHSTTEESAAGTFTGTGWTESGAAGSARGYIAIEWNGVTTAVTTESLTSSDSGDTSFTGLGIKPKILMGIVCGNTSDDTIQTGVGRAFCGYFVTDGSNTYCAGVSQDTVGTVGAMNPSKAYSRWSTGSIDIPDEDGNSAFTATVSSLDSSGVTLNISQGVDGTMWLWAPEDLFGDQAVDETVQISESAGINRNRDVSSTVQISEDVQSVVLARVMEGPVNSSTQPGVLKASSSTGGAVAASDGTTGLSSQ